MIFKFTEKYWRMKIFVACVIAVALFFGVFGVFEGIL
jgi:hypothetical protein